MPRRNLKIVGEKILPSFGGSNPPEIRRDRLLTPFDKLLESIQQ
jgi:hypothetical protein